MGDILVFLFMVYTIIVLTLGISLLFYGWWLTRHEIEDDANWSDWHDIGERSICGRKEDVG